VAILIAVLDAEAGCGVGVPCCGQTQRAFYTETRISGWGGHLLALFKLSRIQEIPVVVEERLHRRPHRGRDAHQRVALSATDRISQQPTG